jgi:hypothetical protein
MLTKHKPQRLASIVNVPPSVIGGGGKGPSSLAGVDGAIPRTKRRRQSRKVV